MQLPGGRLFQAERRVSAKGLRQKRAGMFEEQQGPRGGSRVREVVKE